MIPFASCLYFHHDKVLRTKWLLTQPEASEEGVTEILKSKRGLFIKLSETSNDAPFSTSRSHRQWILHSQTGRKLSFSKRYAIFGSRDEAEDRLLLQVLGSKKPSAQYRFYTISRKRRRRPPTRALKTHPSLLDDMYNATTQCALRNIGDWNFNAFALDSFCGGRPVTVLCTYLVHKYGLHSVFHFDFVNVWKFFSLIEDDYHSSNPYHNAIHAADVVQAMHCYLQETVIRKNLTDMECLAALIAAVSHDLDHPGVNQHFLIATDNYLTVLYNNASVLENHHWRCGMACLHESGLIADWLPEKISELQKLIKSLILATDITCQNEFLSRLKEYQDKGTMDMSKPECREFCLQIALKCADICNQCRNWEMSRTWASKICDEFYRQGDFERRLCIPVTPLCDRFNNSVAKIQIGFIKYVVMPLFDAWNELLKSKLSRHMKNNLQCNLKRWEVLLLEDSGATTHSYESSKCDIDGENRLSSSSMSAVSSLEGSLLGSLESITHTRQLARRHSLPHSSLGVLPRTVIRRESLTEEGHVPVVHETLLVGRIISDISEHCQDPLSPSFRRRLIEGCEYPRSNRLFQVDRRKSLPIWTRSGSIKLLDPSSVAGHSSTDPHKVSSTQDKNVHKSKAEIAIRSKERLKTLHRSSSDCSKSQGSDNHRSDSHRSSNKGRRSSLESALKCKNTSEREINPQNLLRSRHFGSVNGSTNKENRRSSKHLLKTRLWKSLNQEDEECIIKDLKQEKTEEPHGGSAPLLNMMTNAAVRRLCEHRQQRRGSAPIFLSQGENGQYLCWFTRRGSAPGDSENQTKPQTLEELRASVLGRRQPLHQCFPLSTTRRGSLPLISPGSPKEGDIS